MPNTRISDMPAATSLSGTEVIPLVQLATNKTATPILLASFLGAMGATAAINYRFSILTADSDPGDGYLRLSSSTQLSSTVVRTDLLDILGADVSALIDEFDNSTNPVNKGYLRLHNTRDPSKWIVFSVQSVASPSGYRNIGVTVIDGSGANPFANGDYITLTFARTGDKGDIGLTGPPGVDGATWYEGTTVPSGALGVDGDFYFRSTTEDVYKKITGTWTTVANLKGSTGAGGDGLVSYFWESEEPPIAGTHRRWYAERDGSILWCKGGVVLADGISSVDFDVLLNGATIFPSSAKPTVAAGQYIGPVRVPDVIDFVDGDYFEIVIINHGSAQGPLRLYIKFQYEGVPPVGGGGGQELIDVVAAEDLAAYKMVTAQGNLADSANSGHRGKIVGMTTTPVLTGNVASLVDDDEVTNGGWSWSPGQKLFLNGTSISATPPSSGFSQMIGVAKNATTVIVKIESAIQL